MQPVWPERTVNAIACFKAYRLGAVLAYNLCEYGSTTQGRERLQAVLGTLPVGSSVMLVFGEIDCRIHISRRWLARGGSPEDAVQECVDRYCIVLGEIQAAGFAVSVWNTVPSSPLPYKDGSAGTCLERNALTRAFNSGVEDWCKKRGAKFVSIFDALLLPDGTTNPYYYMDNLHLSQRAMLLALAAIR